MAVNRWLGHSKAVQQVVTLVVGSTTNGHTFVTTMNGKSYTYAAGAAETTSTIASAIQALLADSDEPEFREVEWTVDTATVTGTARTAGVPFTVSKSGTGTYTLTTTTDSAGPSHADDTGNWSAGTLPAVGEDILIDQGADILYGLDGITPAVYASFKVKASFEGNIGLPFTNDSGYVEYRTRGWPMATGVPVTVGQGEGDGPRRVVIEQATALDLTVVKTGSRLDESTPVVVVYGHSSGTIDVISGDVGVAADDDTKAGTTTTLTCNEGATVVNGPGATVTTCNQRGAAVTSYGALTTLNQTSGTTTLHAAPTTVTCDGGTVVGRFEGTAATLTFRGQGGPDSPIMDFSADQRARTVTNHTFTGGAALRDPDNTTTWTNAGTWDRASLAASDLGARFSLLKS
jgi:hypothetical protein